MNYPVRLISASEGVCFLTAIGGKFVGDDQHVELSVAADNYWYLSGQAGDSADRASAYCVRWSDFGATTGRALSGAFDVRAPLQGGTDAQVGLWDSRSFCFLTGLQAGLSTPAAYARIEPGFGQFDLQVRSENSFDPYRQVRASASCAYLGQAADLLYAGGDPAAYGEYSWHQGQDIVFLTGTDDSICFLTGIEGQFDEDIRSTVAVTPGNGRWILWGDANPGREIGARARCVPLYQHVPRRILDPGFENQTQRDLAFPWVGEGSASKGFDINMGYANSGANNAWIVSTTNSGWSGISQRLTVQQNTMYTLSAMVKTSNVNNQAKLGVRGTSGQEIARTQFGSSCVGFTCCVGCGVSYSRRSLTFNSGNNSEVTIFVGFDAPGGTSYIQIDDWRLIQN
jgi:hypothetical protein